ncbi:twinstar-like protein [Nemania serpens]|nr:twinstar-like protein [Nemania serpens]
MASGVTVSDACKTKIAELPTSLPAPNYIIFKVSDDAKSIVVADSGKTSTWGDFTAKLPAAECRWALYNFLHGNEKDGFKYSKVFIAWTPDDVKNKIKLLYASSKATMKGAITGIAVEISATISSDISYDEVVKKL